MGEDATGVHGQMGQEVIFGRRQADGFTLYADFVRGEINVQIADRDRRARGNGTLVGAPQDSAYTR